jgi:hypothetical protein
LSDSSFHLASAIYLFVSFVVFGVIDLKPVGFVDGYYDRALNLLHYHVYGAGVQPSAFFPPGYSLMLWLGLLFLGNTPLVVFLVNIGVFAVAVYFFRYVLKASGVRQYNFIGLVPLLSIGRLFYHFVPVSDAISSHIVVLSLCFLVLSVMKSQLKCSLLPAFAAGILFGFGALIRANLILLAVPFLAIIAFSPCRFNRVFKNRALVSAVFAVGIIIPVGLWGYRNARLFNLVFRQISGRFCSCVESPSGRKLGVWRLQPLSKSRFNA